MMQSSYSFEDQARIIMLNGYMTKLKTLQKSYYAVYKKFKALINELDSQYKSNKEINEICSHLTIHSSELEIISENINNISNIIETIRLELSN